MLDHAGFAVSDYRSSKAFYQKALAPLGITLIARHQRPGGRGSVKMNWPFFWIEAQGQPVRGRLHVAFRADDRERVDRFHAAALGSRRNRQRRRREARDLPPALLQRVRPRPPTATTSRQSATAPSSTRPKERTRTVAIA